MKDLEFFKCINPVLSWFLIKNYYFSSYASLTYKFCQYLVADFLHFLYWFIIWLHLISSFSLTRSLLVPYAYISIESLDCVLLSSFERMKIWLISSVKTLCLSFLNLCRGFYINLMFFIDSLWYISRLALFISVFSR